MISSLLVTESKDKADKETLHKALDLNKEILHHIDMSIHNRNQELRLIEIYSKMDSRSTAVYDKIKKFKVSIIYYLYYLLFLSFMLL